MTARHVAQGDPANRPQFRGMKHRAVTGAALQGVVMGKMDKASKSQRMAMIDAGLDAASHKMPDAKERFLLRVGWG